MKIRITRHLFILLFLVSFPTRLTHAQDYDDDVPASSREEDACNGIFLSYAFESRKKLYPRVKNATAQAWAFKSTATILNTGLYELKAWKMFIGFKHDEILVSAGGAVLVGGDEYPAHVGNGTYLSGFPQSDLKRSIDTAGDLAQIQVTIELTGTQFGVKPPGTPMPKTIRIENDGYKCPAAKIKKTRMTVCCVRNPKIKVRNVTTKFLPRQDGDLTIAYDVLQAFEGNYLAQVTMENNNPLGRLDHWNLTWEWMRGEFISTMRGAYTHKIDYSDCIYGPAGQYYKGLDFTQVMNCQKKPIIADMPTEKALDEKLGNLPFCCKNGSLLPTIMNAAKSKTIFQVQVYKIPPDMNRTTIFPPEKWKLEGILNPDYKCGSPIRVDSAEFPSTLGLDAVTTAIASWQIVCNITRPKARSARCCVSFSSYYNDSVIPCSTCSCGCEDSKSCDPDAPAMLLPPEALLVPFQNRTAKAAAWAKIKHRSVKHPSPCGDNCGVSVNWHLATDYKSGWTARITLFNWEEVNFEDWFLAVRMKKAYAGYENVYSFNGTKLKGSDNMIFMHGLQGLTYLMGETNGTTPGGPRVPGKQQSVISFTKKQTPGIKVAKGDGFPTKVLFNGEECTIPTEIPTGNGNRNGNSVNTNMVLIALGLCVFVVMKGFY